MKRVRNLLASYTVHASETNGTPIPSHFSDSGFCIGAMDNSDYADKHSLSGTQKQALHSNGTIPRCSTFYQREVLRLASDSINELDVSTEF